MKMLNLQIEIFCLMAVGYLLAKKGYFNRQTRTQLINIVITVILPCATIKSFEIDIEQKLMISCLFIILISFCIQILYIVFNRIFYKNLDEDKKVCCQYATIVSNSGFMGMPLAEGVYGSTGLLYASIFLIPQRIFMWSSGLSLFAKKKSGHVLKQVLTHPCIIAVYIGIAIMILLHFGIHIPMAVNDTIIAIGNCNTAVSMFVIGGILSEIDYHSILDKQILIYSFYRLILLPLLILVIVRALRVDVLPANLCVLLSAMPAASTTAMLAQKYNGDALFASQLVFVSTLFSLVTLPLLTLFFQFV